jgi:hypothetical protein
MKILHVLILIFICSGLGYIYGYNRSETSIIERNITKWEYVANETLCVKYEVKDLNLIKYQMENISIYFNMTNRQFERLINLKVPCNNIGCAEGAIRMKYLVFDIFNIEHPKFSERPSIGWDDVDPYTYLKVSNGSFGQYIELNNREWYIFKGQKEYNLSFLCFGNNTYQTLIDKRHNITLNLTVDNLSYMNNSLWMPAQGNKIYLKHV